MGRNGPDNDLRPGEEQHEGHPIQREYAMKITASHASSEQCKKGCKHKGKKDRKTQPTYMPKSLSALAIIDDVEDKEAGCTANVRANIRDVRRSKTTTVCPYFRNDILDMYDMVPLHPHTVPKKEDPVGLLSIIGEQVESAGERRKLESLRKVRVQDMKLPSRHTGCVLFCRVMTLPAVGLGLGIAVEDQEGACIIVNIDSPYSLPALCISYDKLRKLFPVGTILAIREPYVHWSPTIQGPAPMGQPEIWVRVITDIEVLPGLPGLKWRFDSPERYHFSPGCSKQTRRMPSEDGRVEDVGMQLDMPSLESFKTAGNQAMKIADWETAQTKYSQALRLPRSDISIEAEVTLRLNRALAYLHDGLFGPCLRDCLTIETLTRRAATFTMTPAQKLKVAFRKLQASYELRLYETATITFEACERFELDKDKLATWKERLRLRSEEERGQFGLLFDSWRNLKWSSSTKFDIADYRGPIAVREIKGKGRGLVVTSDVSAGTILLVEKPMVEVIGAQTAGVVIISKNVAKSSNYNQADNGITCACVRALLADPSKALAFEGLCNRPLREAPTATEDERVKAILEGLGPVDPADLFQKFLLNGYSDGDPERLDVNIRLFPLFSLINHSCLETVVLHEIGDVIIVSARNDLQAGDELLYSYVNNVGSYSTRQTALQRIWNFKCQCELCLADEQDDHQERARLMKEEWPTVNKTLLCSDPGHCVDDHGTFRRYVGGKSHTCVMSYDVQKAWNYIEKDLKPWREFVSKLEKTYAPGRNAIKTELIQVMGTTPDLLSFNGPRPVDKLREKYVQLVVNRGAVLATPAERRETGQIFSRYPPVGSAIDICSPILSAGMMHRMSGNIFSAETHLRTAYAMFQVLEGQAGTIEEFRRAFPFHMSAMPDPF